jgi:hypothetical protein
MTNYTTNNPFVTIDLGTHATEATHNQAKWFKTKKYKNKLSIFLYFLGYISLYIGACVSSTLGYIILIVSMVFLTLFLISIKSNNTTIYYHIKKIRSHYTWRDHSKCYYLSALTIHLMGFFTIYLVIISLHVIGYYFFSKLFV